MLRPAGYRDGPQAHRPPSVAHAEQHGFENIPLALVRLLGRVRRDSASLLGKGEVGIAGRVGLQHSLISGERSGDPELLRRPVNVGQCHTPVRLDQATQPHARPEDELGAAGWLRPVRDPRPKAAAVSVIGTYASPAARSERLSRSSRSGLTRGSLRAI